MGRIRRSAQGRQRQKGESVIIMVRVSDTSGREASLISPDVQEDVCRKWAEREGHPVVDVVIDLDKSGREFRKRSVVPIIRRIERGEAKGVLVWKISRWGRNLRDSLLNIAELQAVGGWIASATENLDDIESPMGRFSLTQMLAIAQLQSDQIGETWENIREYRRDNKLVPAATRRFGYIQVKFIEDEEQRLAALKLPGAESGYVQDPLKSQWLRDAYLWYVQGLGFSKIVKRMQVAGIKTTRGSSMTVDTLTRVLDAGFGAGIIVSREEGNERADFDNWTFTEGAHQPVITPEEWEAYKRRRRLRMAPRSKSPTIRLSGILYCGTCQGPLKANWTFTKKKGHPERHKYRYRIWQCQRRNPNVHAHVCADPTNIYDNVAEAYVLDWLKSCAKGEGAMQVAISRREAADRARADMETINKDIARAKKTKTNLALIYADPDEDMTKEDYDAAVAAQNQKIAHLDSLRGELDVDIEVNDLPNATVLGAVVEGWDAMPPELVNAALKKIIDHIEVGKRSKRKGEKQRSLDERLVIIPRWEKDKKLRPRLLRSVA